jgi:hypothetical protein
MAIYLPDQVNNPFLHVFPVIVQHFVPDYPHIAIVRLRPRLTNPAAGGGGSLSLPNSYKKYHSNSHYFAIRTFKELSFDGSMEPMLHCKRSTALRSPFFFSSFFLKSLFGPLNL